MMRHGMLTDWGINRGPVSKLINEYMMTKGRGSAGVYKTVTGNPISISDALASKIKSLSVSLSPIQDLHGQDAPYPAGGGKNKIDVSRTDTSNGYISGVYINNTGASVASASFDTSEYQPILADTVYTASGIQGNNPAICFYDNSKTFILGVAYGGQTSITFTTPSNAAFFRMSWNRDYKPQLELGSTATAWSPYSNICPITGRDSVTVTRTGVNVWDEEWEVGGIDVGNGENVTATSKIRSKNYISVVPGVSYYFKAPDTIGLRLYEGDKHYIKSAVLTNIAYTIPANIRYVRFIVVDTTTYNHDVFINYPSTDHDYHPGNVESATVQLGQTVYGGTVDVVSGKLTVDRAIKTFDGTETYTWEEQWHSLYTRLNVMKRLLDYRTSIVCDVMPTTETNHVEGNVVGVSGYKLNSLYEGQNWMYFQNTEWESKSEAVSWITENVPTVVYELATPFEITLTPAQLSTLKGDNNVWSDGDEISMTYKAASE